MSVQVRIPRIGGIEFSSTRLMRSIGAAVIGRIRSRTTSGRDVSGRAFRALSPGYAKQKRKALGHAKADLTVSGRMLNDIQAKPRPTGVTIGFSSAGGGSGRGGTFIQRSRARGAADKALFHNETGRVKREFFGLSDDDEEFILSQVENFIARQL